MKNPAYSLKSLGCARSLVDSESMVDQLNQLGLTIVPEGSSEEIFVLNTCSFIQAAIEETEKNIDALIVRKQQGDLKVLVVAGCYPSRYKRTVLEEKYPDVDLWFSTKEEHLLQDKLSELVFQKRFQPVKKRPYIKLTPSHFAYLKISEGCNNWCSFCTIPKIRGEHTSKPLEAVVADAQKQIDMGVRELVLIAEDTTCWGEDIYGKPSLPLLLEALNELDVTWIRPMYIFPSRVDDDLVRVIKNSERIANYIDMPIQHVNTQLLEAMNRKHDKNFLEGICRDLFQEIPDLSLRTTFITGFPGETDEHVAEVCEFIERFEFSQLGCFTYSKERETRSARMANPVALDVAQKRLDKIMRTQYGLLQDRLPGFLGQELMVIYEGDRVCRSYREAPEVDSVIVLDAVPESVGVGDMFLVTITGMSGYDLLGRVVSR